MIDNRVAPPEPGVARFFEGATVTCNHCQRQVIRNPERQRERAWCWNCDAYICDPCEAVRAVAGCKTFSAIIAEADRLAHKGLVF